MGAVSRALSAAGRMSSSHLTLVTPLDLDVCPGGCDPSLPPPSETSAGSSSCARRPHCRLGWTHALLTHFRSLFWFGEDIEEINRNHFTPFIL